MISLFVDKDSDEPTQKLYQLLNKMDLPEGVNITINNLEGAESGILREEGRVVDISLANCYALEDVVRELILLMI
ncbi:hypothetical protein [Flavilitoribacter nigricans]|uniref:Uncharacterized protein n=1 Tax=Flavilitoribacter nigricans (strain ATCC 23147 / DSM 23189 / NBRC 102662 / NCIMB 1420 / SS-2) TaxID=1122177 RepID=A0A2D0NHG1_FLAN2|nr:hypothetical protein [Flavilitoribacter nigricans]PHN07826.1 hypothetical protein CRP01_04705 [Flavilitoribacter nigricans DSM 23189 = NBRC 102662]